MMDDNGTDIVISVHNKEINLDVLCVLYLFRLLIYTVQGWVFLCVYSSCALGLVILLLLLWAD